MATQLLDDGTIPLTADWNAGAHNISSTKTATADTHLTPLKDVKTAITAGTAGLAKTTDVTTAIATATAGLVKANGTVAFTGDVDLGTKKITKLGTPTADTDAANKAYVDSKAGGGGATGSLPIGTIITTFSPYETDPNGDIKELNGGEYLLCDGRQIVKTEHADLTEYFKDVLKGDFYTNDGFVKQDTQDKDHYTLPNIKPKVTSLYNYKFKLCSYIKAKK